MAAEPPRRPKRSGLPDRFGLDLDGDLLADDDAAGLEGLVPGEAEALPVELGLGREPDAHAAPGIGGTALERQLERHRPGDALDGEVALDHVVALPRLPHRPALVGHGRPGLDVEEVAGAKVTVALLVAGVDAAGLDGDGDRRLEGVLGDLDRAGEVGEAAPGLGDHQVADGEADLAVAGVEAVGPGGGELGTVDDTDGRVGSGGQAHGVSSDSGAILTLQSLLLQVPYSRTIARASFIPGIVDP